MKKKVLLITHSVDFGNNIIAENLVKIFSEHTQLIHFSYSHMNDESTSDSRFKKLIPLWSRLQSIIRLYQTVIKPNDLHGYTIVFQGISPALFSFPFLTKNRKVIIMDWTRKLYEPLRNEKISPSWLTLLHRFILNSCDEILCVTSSVQRSVIDGYRINQNKVHKIILPFDTKKFTAGEPREDSKIKLFFVGGDFIRKGGDLLVNWYKKYKKKNVTLTIVTQDNYDWPEGVDLIKNDPIKGIKDEFPKHDIFVMPTRWDSYPQVLIEASASGLAVISSCFALGAPDIVKEDQNGFICQDFDIFFEKLEYLIDHPETLKKFKTNSPQIAAEVYNPQKVFSLIEPFI